MSCEEMLSQVFLLFPPTSKFQMKSKRRLLTAKWIRNVHRFCIHTEERVRHKPSARISFLFVVLMMSSGKL